MRILLTNDDGIGAPGLLAAYRALTARGHKVVACAPGREMSFKSHSVTLAAPLRTRLVAMPGSASGLEVLGLEVDGTPADCARLGFTVFFPGPDLVVSGINSDTNLGYDANYSGTVAAALEAAGTGLPALAASLERSGDPDWASASGIVVRAAEAYASWGIPPGVAVNLNIPRVVRDPGWVWAPLNPVPVPDEYLPGPGGNPPGGAEYDRVHREDECPAAPGSDLALCRLGRVTLSPISAISSHEPTLARLKSRPPL
jgi:5'/3'-nucleotidase SurE